jgi:hypothetical protein
MHQKIETGMVVLEEDSEVEEEEGVEDIVEEDLVITQSHMVVLIRILRPCIYKMCPSIRIVSCL